MLSKLPPTLLRLLLEAAVVARLPPPLRRARSDSSSPASGCSAMLCVRLRRVQALENM
jgi:hypothetical protein